MTAHRRHRMPCCRHALVCGLGGSKRHRAAAAATGRKARAAAGALRQSPLLAGASAPVRVSARPSVAAGQLRLRIRPGRRRGMEGSNRRRVRVIAQLACLHPPIRPAPRCRYPDAASSTHVDPRVALAPVRTEHPGIRLDHCDPDRRGGSRRDHRHLPADAVSQAPRNPARSSEMDAGSATDQRPRDSGPTRAGRRAD